jgi:hypothetical protein
MNKRAQSTLEYFIFFSLVVASLVTMQVYLKRGMQGRLKATTEQLNDGVAAYSPSATESIQTITRNVEEFSSSNVICRAEDGSLRACDNQGALLEKVRITQSKVTMDQITDRLEATLPLIDEPRR